MFLPLFKFHDVGILRAEECPEELLPRKALEVSFGTGKESVGSSASATRALSTFCESATAVPAISVVVVVSTATESFAASVSRIPFIQPRSVPEVNTAKTNTRHPTPNMPYPIYLRALHFIIHSSIGSSSFSGRFFVSLKYIRRLKPMTIAIAQRIHAPILR